MFCKVPELKFRCVCPDSHQKKNLRFLDPFCRVSNDNLNSKLNNIKGKSMEIPIFGTPGPDLIELVGENEIVFAGDGNDTVDGSFAKGNNRLDGGKGNDKLFARKDDILIGGRGNDLLDATGGNGGNRLHAGAENDQLFAGINDLLIGGRGNDQLFAGKGYNRLVGGQGEDQFWIATAELPDSKNKIFDFEIGTDKLGIGGLAEVHGFGDLELVQTDKGTVIKIAGKNVALLKDIAATDLSADDFLIDSPFDNLLDAVQERGYIRVGVSGQTPGFSLEENGEYTGIDADFGRALAVALFGDPNAVEFVNQTNEERFSNVAQGIVDVTAQSATASLSRDASEDVDFAPVYFYDGQKVLVKEDSGIDSLPELDGLPIGTKLGSTSIVNLEDTFDSIGVELNLVTFVTDDELYEAYESGEVTAVSTDLSNIIGRIPTLSDPDNAKILDEILSKEPLAMAMPEKEPEFAAVVRWTTNAVIQAEEFGISSDNLDDVLANTNNPAIKRFLGLEENLGEALGLENDFVVKIIEEVGNYGEIYNRHFGDLGLPRDLNNIWTEEGGLLYSPPFSGSTDGLEDELIDNDDRNVLEEVLERGYVKVGVRGNSPGFSQEIDGEFSGLDIDFGRAIAAAIFDDPNAVEFVVFSEFSQAFPNTANGVFDVTISSVTQNIVRDGALGVDFASIYAYDAQSIIAEEGVTEFADLADRPIAVLEGTDALQNLEDAFERIGENFEPVVVSNPSELFIPFLEGEADAVSRDGGLIVSGILDILSRADEFPPDQIERLENFVIVDQLLSKEPLSFMVDENQAEWTDVIKWIGASIVQAEEFGIDSENIADIAANTDNSAIKRFLGLEGDLGMSLGISNNFAFNAVSAVGNISEVVERNFGGIVGLEGNINDVYTEGGLFYSPPFI